jgi:hypothetical protein
VGLNVTVVKDARDNDKIDKVWCCFRVSRCCIYASVLEQSGDVCAISSEPSALHRHAFSRLVCYVVSLLLNFLFTAGKAEPARALPDAVQHARWLHRAAGRRGGGEHEGLRTQ